jgi:hypothetical protein
MNRPPAWVTREVTARFSAEAGSRAPTLGSLQTVTGQVSQVTGIYCRYGGRISVRYSFLPGPTFLTCSVVRFLTSRLSSEQRS